LYYLILFFFFFQAEDGIRDFHVTGVQTCALPIYLTQLALTLAPNAPALYNADGSLNWENSTWDNPLRWKNQSYTSKNVQWLTSWTVQGKLSSWAMVKVLAGYNESRNEERKLLPHTFYSPAWGMTSAASSSMLNEGRS